MVAVAPFASASTLADADAPASVRSPMTRRLFMNALVSVASVAACTPAGAVPALAAGTAGDALDRWLAACSYPDHARKLLAVYERWCAKSREDIEGSDQFERRMVELTGLCRDAWRFDDDEFERTLKKVSSELHDDPVDEYGASIIWNEIHDLLDPLCREVASLPVRSVADLALQARALALHYAEYWTGDEDAPEGMNELITNVCALAGIEPMPDFPYAQTDDEQDDEDEEVAA
jgi:hypothetical protein